MMITVAIRHSGLEIRLKTVLCASVRIDTARDRENTPANRAKNSTIARQNHSNNLPAAPRTSVSKNQSTSATPLKNRVAPRTMRIRIAIIYNLPIPSISRAIIPYIKIITRSRLWQRKGRGGKPHALVFLLKRLRSDRPLERACVDHQRHHTLRGADESQ